MVAFNSHYLQTHRGMIKVGEIIIGIILSAMICSSTYYGEVYCYGEGRMGYTSTLNFICLIINIVLFVLNLLDLIVTRMEKIYSLVCFILFLIAFILLTWFLIVNHANHYITIIVATVLLFFMSCLYIYDFKILNGEVCNH